MLFNTPGWFYESPHNGLEEIPQNWFGGKCVHEQMLYLREFG